MKKETTSFGFFSAGNNVALATALALAGIPWHDDNEPVRVEFDAEYTASKGCKTVEEARKNGHPGKIAYLFASDSKTEECVKAFNEANARLDKAVAEGEPVEFFENLPPRVRAEAVAIVLRMRKLVNEAPFHAVPFLRFWDGDIEEAPAADGHGGTQHFPSSKLVRANAPDELLRKMGLKQ